MAAADRAPLVPYCVIKGLITCAAAAVCCSGAVGDPRHPMQWPALLRHFPPSPAAFQGDSLAAIVLGEGCSPPWAALNHRGNNTGWHFLKQHRAGGSLVCVPPHEACIKAAWLLAFLRREWLQGHKMPWAYAWCPQRPRGNFWSAAPHIHVLCSFYAILYVNL